MDLTIHHALLDTTLRSVNLGIQDGKIAVISEEEIPAGKRSIEAGGTMVSPPLIDAHFHLENAFLKLTEGTGIRHEKTLSSSYNCLLLCGWTRLR